MQSVILKTRAAIPYGLWLVFVLLFAVVLAMTIHFSPMRSNYNGLFIGHITGGAIFLGLGCLQFQGRIRNRFPRFHRINGRIMLIAALVSIGCLYALLPSSQCNACLPSQMAVTTLWLISIAAAWLAIRRGDIAAHRLHMIRGYVSASYFLVVRLVDRAIGTDRLLPFVEGEAARLANSDWIAWVIPVLVIEAIARSSSKAAGGTTDETARATVPATGVAARNQREPVDSRA